MGQEIGAVTVYGASPSRGRAAGFAAHGVRVLVTPDGPEQNEAAFETACRMSRAAVEVERLTGEVEHWKGRVRVQDAPPTRIMGTGYVRHDGTHVWLLSRRERGFGAFGFRLDSWDELFRHWGVRVTGHGEDEHGPWWSVENARAALRLAEGDGEVTL